MAIEITVELSVRAVMHGAESGAVGKSSEADRGIHWQIQSVLEKFSSVEVKPAGSLRVLWR